MLKKWRDEKNKCNCFNIMKRIFKFFFVQDKSKVNYGFGVNYGFRVSIVVVVAGKNIFWNELN